MALEISPVEEGRRARIVMEGAGLTVKEIQMLFGYKRPSSVYLLLSGKQPMSVQQMKLLANTAAGQGEWKSVSDVRLLFYMQGGGTLGIDSTGPDGDIPSYSNVRVDAA